MHVERVVVGVDFSQPSNAVAGWVARSFPRAELTLVHCVTPTRVPRFLAGQRPAEEQLRARAREHAALRLEALRSGFGGTAVRANVRTEVRVGRPFEELVAAARECAADLVAVGATGERRGEGGPSGLTAERLASRSPVPVLVCGGLRPAAPRRLLVALDDADITPAVLAWARELAEHFDARVTAVHVVSSTVLSHVMSVATATSPAPEASAYTPDRARGDFRGEAGRWIHELVAGGMDPARVTSEVHFGEPAREIVAAAARLDAELIILGNRGADAVPPALLGSVVGDVLHAASCPVLVVTDPRAVA